MQVVTYPPDPFRVGDFVDSETGYVLQTLCILVGDLKYHVDLPTFQHGDAGVDWRKLDEDLAYLRCAKEVILKRSSSMNSPR